MKITFLIGNGFDLNLGLKTQYKDFLEIYSKNVNSKFESIKYFKSDILRNYDMWSNAERAFGIYTQEFDGVKLTADDFCDFHQDFCESLASYLQEQEISAKLDYSRLGIVFASAIKNFAANLRAAPSEKINSYLRTFGSGFEYSFINFNYTHTLDECVKNCNSFALLGTRPTSNGPQRNIIKEIIHVHGTTSKDMVLGVNDESQISNLDLFQNKGYEYIGQIIKPQTNELNEENIVENTKKIIQNSDLIYIYGMSIGETDAIWWNEVCSVMNRKKNMYLILHAYDAPDDNLIRRTYLTFERERKNILLGFCNLSEDQKESIANRIILTKNNIFGPLQEIAINIKEDVNV